MYKGELRPENAERRGNGAGIVKKGAEEVTTGKHTATPLSYLNEAAFTSYCGLKSSDH